MTLFLFLTQCQSIPEISRTQFLMGHVPVEIKIRSKNSSKTLSAMQEAFILARALEAQLSEYQKDSDISCLNTQGFIQGCQVAESTRELLVRAEEINRLTQGAFNIRFSSPSLDARQAKIQFHDNNFIRLTHPKTRLGLGGIAKGYIVDRMLAYLKAQGLTQVLINAGGDIAVSGKPWKIFIQIPYAEPGKSFREIDLKQGAIASSGNYELGEHIIETQIESQSGKAHKSSQGVSVIAVNLTLADALATAAFILGPDGSKILYKNFKNIQIIWSDPNVQELRK